MRNLRYHNFARTNQFEVQETLDGLEEKFRVFNQDELADALRERLNKLSAISTKWTPDVLSLLLQLSDRPATNSRIEDLELLKSPDIPPKLTWAEIFADDPLDEE